MASSPRARPNCPGPRNKRGRVLTRSARRDLIVRIGHSVRFARLIDTALADAIWERMPIYGTAERTRDGALAVVFELSSDLTLPTATHPLDRSHIAYCLLTRRIVFPTSTIANRALIPWASLTEPNATTEVASIAQGARVSLLHADS